MAHEIDLSNNRTNMAFVGDVPWHSLGHAMDPNAPLEAWKKSAGMEWTIKEACVEYQNDVHDDIMPFPEKKVLYRSDTGSALAVVSEKYKVVQPETVLEFYRDLIDTAGFKMSTAGVLFGGRKFWALAEMGKIATIKKEDKLNGYLLLSTACDGSMATVAQFTSIRVVCNNTLRLAVASANGTSRPRLSVPHSTVFDANKVKAELGLANNSWDVFIEDVRRMADRKLTPQEELQWLIDTFGNPKEAVEDQTNADAKVMKYVHSLYAGHGKGSLLEGSERTLWGLMNATTEYLDFHTGHKTVDGRFDKGQFGESAAIKSKAWDNSLMLLA